MTISIFRSHRHSFFRIAFGLLTLFGSAGTTAISGSTPAQASTAIPTCTSSQLTMSAPDRGQGAFSGAGNQGVDFIFHNIGKSSCSLKGYPRFRFEPSSYKGESIKMSNGGSELFADVPPRLVVIEPGAAASFTIGYGDAYNQGNDPSAGPCLTRRATVSLPASPHSDSVPFTAALGINFCFAGFKFKVTSIQRGRVPKQL
jgi:hypothetical protein